MRDAQLLASEAVISTPPGLIEIRGAADSVEAVHLGAILAAAGDRSGARPIARRFKRLADARSQVSESARRVRRARARRPR